MQSGQFIYYDCSIFHSYLLNFQLPDDFKVFLWMRYMLVWSIIIIMLQNLFAIHTHHFCIYYQFVHNGVCSQLLHIGTVLEICTKLYHQYIQRYIFFQYSPEKLRFFFLIHQLFLKTVKTTLFPHTFKCCCT